MLQETYTAVWHKAGLYDAERASPITWLVMIARNKAIDRARVESGEPRTAPIELASDIPATRPPIRRPRSKRRTAAGDSTTASKRSRRASAR